MAKRYYEPHEETQSLYNQAIDNADLANVLNITVLVDNNMKEIFKVSKCNETEKHKTKDDVNVFINEKVLDQLEPEQRVIVVEESLAGVYFNRETGQLKIEKPDFSAFSGVIRKHTFEVLETVRESIKTIYRLEKEEEDKRKAQTEKAKKNKFSKA